jgi:hypothetical protein
MTENRARLAGKTDQRAGFHRLQPQNFSRRQCPAGRLQIEHLPARHAGAAGAACQAERQSATHGGVGVGRWIGQDLEGKGEQRIARQDRRRFVERLVHGGPAAPYIVIVHRRQIVMHERIAMDAFDRRADIQRCFIHRPA